MSSDEADLEGQETELLFQAEGQRSGQAAVYELWAQVEELATLFQWPQHLACGSTAGTLLIVAHAHCVEELPSELGDGLEETKGGHREVQETRLGPSCATSSCGLPLLTTATATATRFWERHRPRQSHESAS